MTKKHYKAIAEILSARLYATISPDETDTVSAIVRDLADYFHHENINFDRKRFYEAVKAETRVSLEKFNDMREDCKPL